MTWFYPNRIWRITSSKNTVYLTFDDGPIPEVTPWVLDILKEYEFKATFFCIGENVKKHPEIFNRILLEGHAVGNHTFNHLNGRKTESEKYLDNIDRTQKLFDETGHGKTRKIFRPPYGRITAAQARAVQQKGFSIIMWTLLSYDYDQFISKERCAENITENLVPGAVIVFHDSLKAEKNLRYALPETLKHIRLKGWESKAIS